MTFSRRDGFWYCAGVLTVFTIGFLVHALTGNQNSGPAPMHTAMTAPVPVPDAADAPEMSNAPDVANAPHAPGASGAAGSMDEMLSRLESRLALHGGSDSDWELLAQSYEFVGRTADAKLARGHHLPDGAADAAGATGTNGATPGPSVSGEVDLSGALRKQVADGQTLFIVAKSVDSPGPPVAIVRTVTGQWPLHFKLDNSSAMVPGRTLSSAQHVTIEARVSRSGGAAPSSGDFQSPVTPIDPHAAGTVHLVIDHIIG
jgi:hypothetical protein